MCIEWLLTGLAAAAADWDAQPAKPMGSPRVGSIPARRACLQVRWASPRVGSIPARRACLQVRWASAVCGVGQKRFDKASACYPDGVPPRGFDSRSPRGPPAWVRFPPPRLFASSLGQRGLRGGGGAGRRTLPGLKRTLLAGIGTHAARQNCLRVDALKIELVNKNHDFLSHFLVKNDTKTRFFNNL